MVESFAGSLRDKYKGARRRNRYPRVGTLSPGGMEILQSRGKEINKTTNEKETIIDQEPVINLQHMRKRGHSGSTHFGDAAPSSPRLRQRNQRQLPNRPPHLKNLGAVRYRPLKQTMPRTRTTRDMTAEKEMRGAMRRMRRTKR